MEQDPESLKLSRLLQPWLLPIAKRNTAAVIKYQDLLHLLKIRLTENVFPLIPTSILTLTLKHSKVFGLKKWRHFFEQVYRYHFTHQ